MQIRETTILAQLTDRAQRSAVTAFSLWQAGAYLSSAKIADAEDVACSLMPILQNTTQAQLSSFAIKVTLSNPLPSNVADVTKQSCFGLEFLMVCQDPRLPNRLNSSRLRFPALKKECFMADGQLNLDHIAIKSLKNRLLQTAPVRYGNNAGFFFKEVRRIQSIGINRKPN